MDAATKAAAKREKEELEADLEAALATGNDAGVKRLRGEIAKLVRVIKNKSLLKNDSGERSRDNVRQAIKKVVKNLRKGGKAEQALAQHISNFISPGYILIYNQPEGVNWD